VLSAVQVKQKINRIAFEIYEHHHAEELIIVAGISGNGMRLAELIVAQLRTLTKHEVRLVEVKVNKKATWNWKKKRPKTVW